MRIAGHALTALPGLQCAAHAMIAADMLEDAVLQGRPLQVTAQPLQTGSQSRTLQQSLLPARGPLSGSAGLLSPPRQCQHPLRQQRPCQKLCLRSMPWIRPWLGAPQAHSSSKRTPRRQAAGRWSHLQHSNTAHPKLVMRPLRR